MNEFIKQVSKKIINNLQSVKENGEKNYFSFEVDCGTLNDYNNVDIRNAEEFKNIFEELKSMNGPVLYWFEILSENMPEQIRDAITIYRNTENSKATPALKNKFDNNSKCLYVGKVKRGFWGRIIQHLGFYKVNGTQGLQLFYWAKSIKLKVKIHVYEFENDMSDLVSIMELELANKLNPIIGKH